jgi:alanine transaminase
MIPIPQYPLYSATITLDVGSDAPYYLDEDKNWGLDVIELFTQLG